MPQPGGRCTRAGSARSHVHGAVAADPRCGRRVVRERVARARGLAGALAAASDGARRDLCLVGPRLETGLPSTLSLQFLGPPGDAGGAQEMSRGTLALLGWSMAKREAGQVDQEEIIKEKKRNKKVIETCAPPSC